MKALFKTLVMAGALFFAALSSFAQKGVRGQLLAGAAKVDVTPSKDQLGRNSYGILDHTYCRAIIFTNGTTKAGLVNIDGNTNQKVVDAVNARIEAI